MPSSKRRLALTAFFLGAMLTLAACSDNKAETTSSAALVQLDGDAITAAEFDAYLALQGIPNELGQARDRALRTYAQRSAAARAIVNENLLDPATAQAVQRHAANEALIERYLEQELARASSDEELEKYYSANRDSFERIELNLSQIVLRLPPEASDDQRQTKQALAEKIRGQIESGGNFAELARQYSEDPITASNGGAMGWMDEQKLGRELWSSARTLEMNAISQPLQTPLGIHLLKVTDKRVDRTPLEAVKDNIRYRMRYDAKTRLLKDLLDQADYKIETK